MQKDRNSVIGIDEVGRGPLAGPVTVCAFTISTCSAPVHLHGITDSKVLTEVQRILWYRRIKRLEHEGVCTFMMTHVSPSLIDTKGIVHALSLGVARVLKRMDTRKWADIRLDGNLSAPSYYRNQETIIKGDVTEPCISAASVMAKVSRDAYMTRLATRAPHYMFDRHKGYGTILHRQAIRTHGLSPYHRQSFCHNVA